MTWLLLGLTLCVGCASAGEERVATDAAPHRDAPGMSLIDASGGIDGSGSANCTTVDLMKNGNMDGTPTAVNWMETRIDPMYALITDETAAVLAQSGTFRAWMGGLTSGSTGATVTDVLTQDFAIPLNTTKLELTGYYDTRTSETSPTVVYDTAKIDLVRTTGGTLIEQAKTFDNLHATTAYTAFNHVFTTDVSGMTVRLKISSTNGYYRYSSFFFDTLTLMATSCP